MSILSISVQYYGKPRIIAYVPKESFDPAPKVDSAILKIELFDQKKQETEDFFRLVKIGFSSPRKILINNLVNGFKIDKKKTEELLEKLNLKNSVRAQELDLNDWKKLQKLLK